MSPIAYMRRYPTATYFLLAFGISWGGVLVAVGPEGFPARPDSFFGLLPGVVAGVALANGGRLSRRSAA